MLTLKEAAARAGISEDEFHKQMAAIFDATK